MKVMYDEMGAKRDKGCVRCTQVLFNEPDVTSAGVRMSSRASKEFKKMEQLRDEAKDKVSKNKG